MKAMKEGWVSAEYGRVSFVSQKTLKEEGEGAESKKGFPYYHSH